MVIATDKGILDACSGADDTLNLISRLAHDG